MFCGAGGINSFSRLGEPYKQCPLHSQRMHFYLHTPLQALHVGLLQIKMPQPYGWGIDLWSWRDSNPRPEMELLCLLHAYRNIGFRTKLAVPRAGLVYILLFTSNSHKHTA